MESILTSIKKLLGIEEEYEHFDTDIIIAINSVFVILFQIGVGPTGQPFEISDKNAVWDDFFQGKTINLVKSYMYNKVRLMFDPPQTSTMFESMNNQTTEMEFRLQIMVDPFDLKGGDDE